MKKLLSIIAVIAAILMLFTACKTEGTTTDEDTAVVPNEEGTMVEPEDDLTQQMTYSMLMLESSDITLSINDELPVFATLEEMFNIDLQIEAVPGEAYDEKQQIQLATDSMSDMAFMDLSLATRYAQDGMFLDISEYLDHLPNIKAMYEKYPDALTISSLEDGTIYGLPAITESDLERINQVWAYRKDIAETLNLEAPKDFDELYDFLVAVKAENPDAYPFTADTFNKMIKAMTYAYTGIESIDGIGYNREADQFEYIITNPQFKEMLIFMNKLYEEELLDPEFMNLPMDKLVERLLSGNIAITIMDKSAANFVNTLILDSDAESTVFYENMMPIGATEATAKMVANGEVIANQGFVFSYDIENPLRALKLVDYLYSDEGAKLTAWGPEGLAYEMVDGVPVLNEGFEGYDNKEYSGITGSGIYGLVRIRIDKIAQPKQSILDTVNMYEGKLVSPVYLKDNEELTALKGDIQPNLEMEFQQQVAEFIFGRSEITDENLNKLLENYKKLGGQEYLDKLNEVNDLG